MSSRLLRVGARTLLFDETRIVAFDGSGAAELVARQRRGPRLPAFLEALVDRPQGRRQARDRPVAWHETSDS